MLIEAQGGDIRAVADSHRVIYDALERHEDALRQEVRDMRHLLTNWAQTSTRVPICSRSA